MPDAGGTITFEPAADAGYPTETRNRSPTAGEATVDWRLTTEKQINAIAVMPKRQGMTLDRALHDRFGVSSLSALTISEASTLIDEFTGKLQSA